MHDDTPKVLEVNLRPIACAKLGFLSGINTAQQIMEDLYADEVTPMQQYKTGIRVRRSQIDWMWFIKSPNRFKTKHRGLTAGIPWINCFRGVIRDRGLHFLFMVSGNS